MLTTARRASLTRRGFLLEGLTLSWNVIGVIVLAVTALAAHSVVLLAFGLDSLIEIGASTVVIWELSGSSPHRQRVGLRFIGIAFLALSAYLFVQSLWVIANHVTSRPSPVGLSWTAATALVMCALSLSKSATGKELDNPVLTTEAKVTLVDALLATAVTIGFFVAHAPRLQWWWAEPLVALVLCVYAGSEGRASLRSSFTMHQ